MHAVAECARKVAMTGATPVAATNCLNFGNPEKPEIMAQLSAAIDGIAEACTALGTPITGGNVSFIMRRAAKASIPTPVLGIVGILEDVTKAVPASFQREKDAIVLLWPIPRGEEPDPKLKVPLNPPPISQYPLPVLEREPRAARRSRLEGRRSREESRCIRLLGVRQSGSGQLLGHAAGARSGCRSQPA